MKKISCTLLLAVFCAISAKVSAQSESYTTWQLNFTGGYAIASGKGVKGGAAFYIEPQYHVNDKISVGLRWGSALILKSLVTDEFKVAAIGSYLLTGNYYFQKDGSAFRPFGGLGVGYAIAAGAKASVGSGSNTVTNEIKDTSGLAGLVRVGFDISHFRFNVEYNLNPTTKLETGDKIKNSYVGINLGFYFGGGLKK